MRKNAIVGRHLRKKKRTTIADRLAPPVPDLVQRDFTADALDEKWCGNITYVQVGAAWLYLACVIDIRSRRVLGYSMAPHMRAGLVIDALRAAVAARDGDVTGVIFHGTADRNIRLPRSPRSATGTASAGAWAGSARATTTPWPRVSGRA